MRQTYYRRMYSGDYSVTQKNRNLANNKTKKIRKKRENQINNCCKITKTLFDLLRLIMFMWSCEIQFDKNK